MGQTQANIDYGIRPVFDLLNTGREGDAGGQQAYEARETYQLVVTHDSHDAQWLHPTRDGIKAWASFRISEHHIRMEVGVKVAEATELVHLSFEGCHPLPSRVIGTFACLAVGSVAVDIHVPIFARIPA